MDKPSLYNLIIDEEFERIVPELSTKDYEAMEKKILFEGCQEPIVTWQKVIIESIPLYKIYHKHNIPFRYEEREFFSKSEAITYLCLQTIKTEDIPNELYKYCVGKLYEAQKNLLAENYTYNYEIPTRENGKKSNYNPSRYHTAHLVGGSNKLSHSSVYKYGVYSNAIDEIASKVPEIAREILSGKFYVSHGSTLKLSQLTAKSIQRIRDSVGSHATDVVMLAEINKNIERDKNESQQKRRRKPEPQIKCMPQYDPDAELSSLTLTIPMWIKSINRTMTISKFDEASSCALSKLEQQLITLKDNIDTMLSTIQEEHYE